jgi:hypothetical protein
VKKTGTMQQDCANEDEILSLMQSAGLQAWYTTYWHLDNLLGDLNTLNYGEAVGLGYYRHNGSGHMIMFFKDKDGRAGCADPQRTPIAIWHASQKLFDEPVTNIKKAHVFYRT